MKIKELKKVCEAAKLLHKHILTTDEKPELTLHHYKDFKEIPAEYKVKEKDEKDKYEFRVKEYNGVDFKYIYDTSETLEAQL